jgi:ubiquinol-cytochrome c reductase cytochrome c subunit
MKRARCTGAALLAALVAASAAAAAPQPLVQLGLHLYGRYCVSCHGPNGSGFPTGTPAGAGPARAQRAQVAAAPKLRGVGALAADFYLRTGYMPLPEPGVQPRRGHVFLSPRQIAALTAYVASLGPGPAIPTPHPERGNVSIGMRSFTSHCAGCHQIVAEGGFVTGAVAPPLEDATARQIAEAVRVGPYVMPGFSRKAISDAELDSIIAYVQYAKHPDDRGGWALGHVGPVPEGLAAWFLGMAVLVAGCLVLGRRLRE